jgi:ABC-type nitrate/sulfonate/bicarbonate transport system substrate-binding protein
MRKVEVQNLKRFLIVIMRLFWLASPSAAADRVRLSISALDVSFLTAGVASKRGFFSDEGVDVDIDYTMVFASVVRGAHES